MEIALLNMALEKYKRFFRKSYQKSLHNQFFYVKITNCIWIRLWLETHTPGVINEQHVNHEGSFFNARIKTGKFCLYCYDGLCYGLRHDLLQHCSYHRAGWGMLSYLTPSAKWWSCSRLQSSWRCSSLKSLSFTRLRGWLHLKRQSCWSSWSVVPLPSALCAQRWAWSQPLSSRTSKQLASSGPGCRLPSSTFQWRLAGKSSSAVLR